MRVHRIRSLSLSLLAATTLAACGGGGGGSGGFALPFLPAPTPGGGETPAPPPPPPAPPPAPACTESGVEARFACQTGATEPLYLYQWALRQAGSFFAAFPETADGRTDLNVEPVHAAGIKGQGVRVLVLDDGVDIRHPDLAANVDPGMTHNFDDGSADPTPAPVDKNVDEFHGTLVAGVIAAAQNGQGVMGIAPRAILGGARILGTSDPDEAQAYGGAEWSRHAHVINASYGNNPEAPEPYDSGTDQNALLRAFVHLREGKGLVMVKSAGNEYESILGDVPRSCPDVGGVAGLLGCENPANDLDALEPTVIVVGAANALGRRASYSNAGAINWVTGLGGEYGDEGSHGQAGDGPILYSTDLQGCQRGVSRTGREATADFQIAGSATNVRENPRCDYGSLNGTSAAAPSVSGVVALMLSANPALSWRDVRDILRATARKIDADYGQRDGRARAIDLRTGAFADQAVAGLVDGSPIARLDWGWQKNGAGHDHSTWYGFGLVDAQAAVQAAQARTRYLGTELAVPGFQPAFADVASLRYGSVQKLGQFQWAGSERVDALQLRLSGAVCVGSVGIYVKSPAGTVSALAVPYNSFYANGVSEIRHYGLSSYAFHGEAAAGTWEVYAVSGMPATEGAARCDSFAPGEDGATVALQTPLAVEYRVIAAP